MAADNMKDIKRRIKSVGNTMQITKAMELVASSKLKRAKKRSDDSKPFFTTLYETMENIVKNNTDFSSIYTYDREVKKSLYIVISGDRGLAGGYNINLFKSLISDIKDKQNTDLLCIGKKALEYFTRLDFNIRESYIDVLEDMDIATSSDISNIIIAGFIENKYQQVYLTYTKLVSPLEQTPKTIKILPLRIDKNSNNFKQSFIEYEPSGEEVFNSIVPKYISGIVYGACIESFASEQSARRIAMESASDNAKDMINTLSLKYNRARQAAITQEISEIVAGSIGFK